MKKYVLICISFLTLTTCEDVIDVNLNSAEPRLVIEASINWLKNTSGNVQSIKLSLSAPFFDENIQPANGAIVQITDSNSNVFIFTEDANTGVYITNTFTPVLNQSYTLTIVYNNQTYTAIESLVSVVPIDNIEQIDNGGFTGEDIELKAYYTDPLNEENFYLFEFISEIAVIPTLDVYDDEFTDGNQIFGYYTEEDLNTGDEVVIRNYGVSERFYEFMFILQQQGSDEGGGPFDTQPATVRGNCINQTNSENYPFGYFRLSEVDEVIYTVQ